MVKSYANYLNSKNKRYIEANRVLRQMSGMTYKQYRSALKNMVGHIPTQIRMMYIDYLRYQKDDVFVKEQLAKL